MTDSFVRGAQDTTDRVFTLANLDARRPEDVLLSKKNSRGTQWICHTVMSTTRSVRK